MPKTDLYTHKNEISGPFDPTTIHAFSTKLKLLGRHFTIIKSLTRNHTITYARCCEASGVITVPLLCNDVCDWLRFFRSRSAENEEERSERCNCLVLRRGICARLSVSLTDLGRVISKVSF